MTRNPVRRWLFALLSGAALPAPAAPGPVDFSQYAPPPDAVAAGIGSAVRIRLTEVLDYRQTVLHDRFGLLAAGDDGPGLPAFDFTLHPQGGTLVPERRTPVAGPHPLWEFIVSPGQSWRLEGEDDLHAAIPFALKERNADCLHYGALHFRFDESGATSPASMQIASETCQYLQFDAVGRYRVALTRLPLQTSVTAAYQAEERARLPARPLASLAGDFPGADPARFGSEEEIAPAAMTTWGLVVDGVHYTGRCRTRYGDYPYCDGMPLPSYSLAKSLFAGLATMRAELLYPGAANARIADYVVACRGNDAWRGVTIDNALDMATGNYASADVMADEDAAIATDFFIADDHATRIQAACNAYSRRSPPGTRWVYHTSDTYLAGTALTAYVRKRAGQATDPYEYLVVEPIWTPLHLSPLTHATRRSYDAVRQPFFGWGLNFLRDDIAKIGRFLGAGHGRIDGKPVVDEALLGAALQRRADDPGLTADLPGMRYNNGFRALDVAPYLGCREATWVPVLSGFGGIIVIPMPNDTVYYYFSDGGTHRWMAAARESHRLRPMCDSSGET